MKVWRAEEIHCSLRAYELREMLTSGEISVQDAVDAWQRQGGSPTGETLDIILMDDPQRTHIYFDATGVRDYERLVIVTPGCEVRSL